MRGSLPRTPTARQVDVLTAFVAAGGSVPEAAASVGVRPSTAKRNLADLRARSGLTTEQLIYRGRAEGSLEVRVRSPFAWGPSDGDQARRRRRSRFGDERIAWMVGSATSEWTAPATEINSARNEPTPAMLLLTG